MEIHGEHTMSPAIWGGSITLDREFVRPRGLHRHESASEDDPERGADRRSQYPLDPWVSYEPWASVSDIPQRTKPSTLAIVVTDHRLSPLGGVQGHEPASVDAPKRPAIEPQQHSFDFLSPNYSWTAGSGGDQWTELGALPIVTLEHVHGWVDEGASVPERATIRSAITIDVARAHVSDLIEKTTQTLFDRQAYRVRIQALREAAAQDGTAVNTASEKDFWRFVESEPFMRKGNLVLLDNGNLRTIWTDASGNQLGLQFLGSGMVQYVVFKRRLAAVAVSRAAGRDSLEGVRRVVQAYDLRTLIEA